MRNRVLLAARTLAVLLPTLVMAQAMAAQRDGSWEFSGGAGFLIMDRALLGHLASGPATSRFTENNDPGRLAIGAAVRLGYNFSNNFGFSVGTGGARGSGAKYLTPFAAVTYTVNLNAKTSPFLTGGTQFTRITGENNRRTHPTWGAHLGVGVRSMLAERVALRLEGRMGIEHYAELPEEKTAYNSMVTLGLSLFTAGRRAPPVVAAPSCAACPRAVPRVDTVRLFVPFPRTPPPVIVLRDTLVLEGVNFAFDESTLTPESHDILDRVARALLEPQWANVRFEVAGHTSSIGTNEYNLGLSQRRAEAVRAYLVSRGVQDGRMVARGYGRTQPLFPEVREGDAWQNRRVELRRLR
jgi:outer membrane protein OmpA-like peptidoglycan-associated protein